MLWRLLKVLFLAIILFVVLNFLLSNLDSQTLGYKIQFNFNLPPFRYFQSSEIPVGSLLLVSFCLGMVFAAFSGAVSLFYRSREIKAKNRTIRELEKEIEEMRALYSSSYQKNPPTLDEGRGMNSNLMHSEEIKID